MAIEYTEYYDDKKKDVNDAMVRFLIRGTNIVQADAKLLVRKDTGDLQGTIVKAVDKRDLEGTVSTNSDHAIYNEFGTGRFAEDGTGRATPWVYEHPKYGFIRTEGMKPQPFMRPALNNNKPKLIKIAEDEVKKGVNK
jgi:HK97 gp10 family phage protein